MSEKSNRDHDADDANDRELINMEFESMVEGLSLDESAPTTYLDEIDAFVPCQTPRRFCPAAAGHRGGGRHGGLSGIGLRGFDLGDRSWGDFTRGIDA